jgi:mannan endo-1,4-beta-mannosidase
MDLGIVLLESIEKMDKEITDLFVYLGKSLKYGLRYITFENDFPSEVCNEFKKNNLIPIITWELFFPTGDGHNRRKCSKEETHLNELLDGKFDKYLNNFATQAKLWKDIIYLRPLHEFNAGWYVWGGEKNGGIDGGPELIKQCWKYIVKRFRELKVDNVKWIWCPHEPSMHVSRDEWNNIRNYWPGDEYVDLLGIDGFNFYPENPERENPEFFSFESLFSEMYVQIASLSPKPIFIMTGTSEFSREGEISCKSDWINNAFEKIRTIYTQITIVCWFHHKYNEKINWRLDSSEKSIEAFIAQMKKE